MITSNRRTLAKWAAGGLGLLAATEAFGAKKGSSGPVPSKPTVIFVHGSWHWGGCFEKVANLLAAEGYPVVTPDLKSHGYSPASYQDVASMADYTAPVADAIERSERPVVLVGHSMGGVAVSYLGQRYPDRIRKIIYLSAFMLPNGKTFIDVVTNPLYAKKAPELFKITSVVSKGSVLNVSDPTLVKETFYADCSDHDVSVAMANICKITSNVPNLAKSDVTADKLGKIPRVFIECTLDHAIPIDIQRMMQADMPGAKVLSLESSHSPFFSHHKELAAIVSREASDRG